MTTTTSSTCFNQRFRGDDCDALERRAKSVRDELARRRDEMIKDKLVLGPRGIQTHLVKMAEKQQHLREVLNEMDARNCRGGDGALRSKPFWAWAGAKATEDATRLAETRLRERSIDPQLVKKFAVSIGVALSVVLLLLTAPELVPIVAVM